MDAATVLERRLLPRPPIAAFAAPTATVPLGSSAGDICAGGIRTAGAGRGGRTGPRSSRAPTLSVIDLWGMGGSPAKRQRPGRRQREDRPLCSSRLRGGSERASVRPFRRVLTAAKRHHAPDWRDSAANTISERGAAFGQLSTPTRPFGAQCSHEEPNTAALEGAGGVRSWRRAIGAGACWTWRGGDGWYESRRTSFVWCRNARGARGAVSAGTRPRRGKS